MQRAPVLASIVVALAFLLPPRESAASEGDDAIVDPPATAPGDPTYADELVARVRAVHSWRSEQWIRLGHWYKGATGDWRGQPDGPAFYLAPDGKTDPEASRHQQQSMILVPRGTPGLTIVRNLPVFGYTDREGHCELRFEDVRVPAANLIAEEGMGFAIAQARLGPGRIHHCMRCIGMAERALELMCRRVLGREAFGKPLAAQGVIREWIADSRIEIEQARLLTLKAAYLMDTVGSKGAATEISAIKVVAPNMALRVVDRSIQAHGGGGVSDDFPLARMYAGLRTLRFADGPDEVHRRQLARAELGKYAS